MIDGQHDDLGARRTRSPPPAVDGIEQGKGISAAGNRQRDAADVRKRCEQALEFVGSERLRLSRRRWLVRS
jgi:hypothetical protein